MGKKVSITGSEYSDILYPSNTKQSKVFGLGGNDQIGKYGESYGPSSEIPGHEIYGQDGDDRLSAGVSTKYLDGGNGNDQLFLYINTKQRLYGGEGVDSLEIYLSPLSSTSGTDSKKTGKVLIDAGNGDDIIEYRGGVNHRSKTKGNRILGGGGNDTLFINRWHYNDDKTTFDLGIGDDTLKILYVPEAKDILINGGEGYDRIDTGTAWESFWRNLVRVEEYLPGQYALVFANYLDAKGVAYTQTIKVPGFESITDWDSSTGVVKDVPLSNLTNGTPFLGF